MIVYNSVLFSTPEYILFGGMIIWGIITAILAFTIFEHIVIITTSLIGSYLFVRGLSVFIGGFPNEMTIYKMLKSGIPFEPTFYAYLAAIIICFILSIIL